MLLLDTSTFGRTGTEFATSCRLASSLPLRVFFVLLALSFSPAFPTVIVVSFEEQRLPWQPLALQLIDCTSLAGGRQ